MRQIIPPHSGALVGDALNAGYLYLEVNATVCDTHQAVALDIVGRPKTTPIHEPGVLRRCMDWCAAKRALIALESRMKEPRRKAHRPAELTSQALPTRRSAALRYPRRQQAQVLDHPAAGNATRLPS